MGVPPTQGALAELATLGFAVQRLRRKAATSARSSDLDPERPLERLAAVPRWPTSPVATCDRPAARARLGQNPRRKPVPTQHLASVGD